VLNLRFLFFFSDDISTNIKFIQRKETILSYMILKSNLDKVHKKKYVEAIN
jgi:hypothetical protein